MLYINMLFVRSFLLCISKALYVAMAQRLVIVDKKFVVGCEVFSLEHVVCEAFSSLNIYKSFVCSYGTKISNS
jgi:hypothetical protein